MIKDNAPLKPLRYSVAALGALALATTLVVAAVPSVLGQTILKVGHEHDVYQWSNEHNLILKPQAGESKTHCYVDYADGSSDHVTALSSRSGVNAFVPLKGTIVESNNKGEAQVTCADTARVYSGEAMSLAWLPTNALLVLLSGLLLVAPLLPLLGRVRVKSAKAKLR